MRHKECGTRNAGQDAPPTADESRREVRVRCVNRDAIASAMMCVACERAFDVGENNPIMV